MRLLSLIAGLVTALGLLNNQEHLVNLFLDADFIDNKIGTHPCDNTATVWLNTSDLVELIISNGNRVEYANFN